MGSNSSITHSNIPVISILTVQRWRTISNKCPQPRDKSCRFMVSAWRPREHPIIGVSRYEYKPVTETGSEHWLVLMYSGDLVWRPNSSQSINNNWVRLMFTALHFTCNVSGRFRLEAAVLTAADRRPPHCLMLTAGYMAGVWQPQWEALCWLVWHIIANSVCSLCL